MSDCGFQGLAGRTGEVQALRSLLNPEIEKASHGGGVPRAKHQSYPVQSGASGKPGRMGPSSHQGKRQRLGNSKTLLSNKGCVKTNTQETLKMLMSSFSVFFKEWQITKWCPRRCGSSLWTSKLVVE